MADQLMWFKYIVKNVARKHGKTATFMPKPLFGDNGTGMHCHQSLWKDGKPLFAGDGYAGLTEIGAPLHRRHPQARARRSAPSPTRRRNSYRRLVPGLRGAGEPRVLDPQPLGVDPHPDRRGARRRRSGIEVRFPDPTCNPYLAFAAMLMAGLDGIQNKIDPGEPLDKDIYALSPEELKDVPHTPGSLDEALDGAREGPRVPAQGRRLHAGRHRDLDRLQARERGRRRSACARTRYEFALYYDI